MSAALSRPAPYHLSETGGRLRLEFGYGTATEIAELYRELAVTCVQKQIPRVVVIAGDDDRAGERALRDALTMMVLAGIPSGFKLALVIRDERTAYVYRNLPRDLTAAGIAARIHASEEDAIRWLEGEDQARRAA